MIPLEPVSVFPQILFFTLLLASPALAADNDQENSVPPGAAEPNSPSSWYGEGVRPTEPRSPSEELAGFHLPAGFEVRLFAAEPQIAKPMNLAFDTRGRVWVTNSFEYPYPVTDGTTPTDSVRILEDIDGDGRADRSTLFADGLNIPIGVLPYGDGCLCFSIPNIYYLRDTDGDGVCDQREIVLGPFDTTRDTHGMINSMRMGDDGWVYANHGFNNQSTVAGTDGHEVVMNSGNTLRFRPDGSRVEHVTWGQVNPFGRTSDDWGNDFTADCHSKPISQLVRGGQYPGFGRLDDGLGMIPPMMDHLHGSTAISGLVFISDQRKIPSLANQMLSGNVMTSRINRNAVDYNGATAVARELPDFLTSDDPWFRPVDIRLGPDGNLYVADFYNRIIGHYEVPLEHPGRDRYRGRIWQIRSLAPEHQVDSQRTAPESVEQSWNSPNPTVRSLALQKAVEQPGPSLDQLAKTLIASADEGTVDARITAIWYLQQRGLANVSLLERVTSDPSAILRTHGCRAIAASLDFKQDSAGRLDTDPIIELAVAKLGDENAHVQCAAADALGQTQRSDAIVPLLDLLTTVDPSDHILRQTIRIAVRNISQSQTDFDSSLKTLTGAMTHVQQQALAEIMLAVRTPVAAESLMAFLRRDETPPSESLAMMQHIITHTSPDRLGAVIDLARQISRNQPLMQRTLADALVDTCGTKGIATPPSVRIWLDDLIQVDLDQLTTRLSGGQPLSIAWQDERGNAWPTQTRHTDDTDQTLSVASSFPLGESYMGQWASSPFDCPAEISFRIAGHNRRPDEADSRLNRIELADAVTGLVLQTAFPPRHDAAVAVHWDCQSTQGSSVLLRVIDGDSGAGYAWIAVGGFDPAWLSESDDSLQRILATLTRYRMTDRRADLVALLALVTNDPYHRAQIAATLAELDNHKPLARLLTRASQFAIEPALVDDWIARAQRGETVDEIAQISIFAKELTTAQQVQLAVSLASDTQTVPVLISLIENGLIAPEVLLEKTVWDPLQTVGDANLVGRAETVRATAKPVDVAVEKSMAVLGERLVNFEGNMELGRTLFTKHCAVCHQLGGQGELIGPQLDGVGARNVQRLLEDIMVPDRNVDKAFRTTTFLTDEGSVLNGLVRDENESRVLVVGPDGKTHTIPLSQIELRREAVTSLMPSNFQQTVGDDTVAEIVHYLQRAAPQR